MEASHLAYLLKRHRKQHGLTQKELAGQINFHHTVVSRTESQNGRYLPTEEYLRQFIAILDLDTRAERELWKAFEAAGGAGEASTIPIVDSPSELTNRIVSRRGWIGAQWRINPSSTRWVIAGMAIIVCAMVLGLAWKRMPLKEIHASPGYETLPRGAVLFETDFEDGAGEDWVHFNAGKWEVFDLNGNRVYGVIQPDPLHVPDAFLSPAQTWRDYRISTEIQYEPGVYEQIYIVVRSQGSSNNCSGYRVGGNRLGINIFRFEFQDGHCLGETLAENPRYSLPAGQPFRLEVIAVGAQISAYLDGELVVEAQDAMYPSGGIDLLAYEVQWAAFDNLMVEKE